MNEHPCENCLRWSECNGVDWETCPDRKKHQYDIETITQLLDETWIMVKRVVGEAFKIDLWALANRPRLRHLTVYGKKSKTRKKNIRRIIREYAREAKNQ